MNFTWPSLDHNLTIITWPSPDNLTIIWPSLDLLLTLIRFKLKKVIWLSWEMTLTRTIWYQSSGIQCERLIHSQTFIRWYLMHNVHIPISLVTSTWGIPKEVYRESNGVWRFVIAHKIDICLIVVSCAFTFMPCIPWPLTCNIWPVSWKAYTCF